MNATTLAIQPNIFYTPEEVAALLRVPMQSVQALLENGVATIAPSLIRRRMGTLTADDLASVKKTIATVPGL